MFGSTAIAVSFCDAAAVSWFTVIAGAKTLVPSSGLERTCAGVIAEGDVAASSWSASCSINAEKRVCRPAVPFTAATLPARVVRSYVGWSALALCGVPGNTMINAEMPSATIRWRSE